MRSPGVSRHGASPGWHPARALTLGVALAGYPGSMGCTGRGVVGLTDAGTPPGQTVHTTPWAPPWTPRGGFTDLTRAVADAPPFALDPGDYVTRQEPETTVGIVADGDGAGDGDAEVILAATGPSVGRAVGRRPMRYRYDRATRGLVPMGPLQAAGDTPLLGVVDLDGDGLGDLVLRQGAVGVAWGMGGGAYAAPMDLAITGIPAGGPSTGAVALDDLDGDGWLDVVTGHPGCDPTAPLFHVLVRTGARTWTDHTDWVTGGAPMQVYAITAAALHPGEETLMACGRSCAGNAVPVFFRQTALDADGLPRFEPFDPTPAHVAYNPMSLSLSAMTGTVGDINGDGLPDLFITIDPNVITLTGTTAWPFTDHTADTGLMVVSTDLGAPMIPWSTALVDLDQDGLPDVVATHGNDDAAWFDASDYKGPQWVTAHLNQGDGTFRDVTDRVALGRRGQWRALTVSDLDADGDADLVIGGSGELPRVYRNDLTGPWHGMSLRFQGTTSNHLGVGARVRVTPRGARPTQTFFVTSPASPERVQAPWVFVGLGAATEARVQVQWPSGTLQDAGWLTADTRHTLQEPAVLTVDPPSRHHPADGQGTVTLRVTPRAADGSLRPDARVEVSIVQGAGQVQSVTPDPAGGFTARVRAPAAPGTTVLEARIDGIPVGVHPRVWWD